MTPTVGRIVHFHQQRAPEGVATCAAIITEIIDAEKGEVRLYVFDHVTGPRFVHCEFGEPGQVGRCVWPSMAPVPKGAPLPPLTPAQKLAYQQAATEKAAELAKLAPLPDPVPSTPVVDTPAEVPNAGQ